MFSIFKVLSVWCHVLQEMQRQRRWRRRWKQKQLHYCSYYLKYNWVFSDWINQITKNYGAFQVYNKKYWFTDLFDYNLSLRSPQTPFSSAFWVYLPILQSILLLLVLPNPIQIKFIWKIVNKISFSISCYFFFNVVIFHSKITRTHVRRFTA